MGGYFYCYSYRLMYYLKSQGIRYIRYGFNKKNHLKYFVFPKDEQLNRSLRQWDEQKSKVKEMN